MLLFLNVIYVLIAIAMIALILMQRGAGAQAGSGFGAGASGTVFGSRGASNFLSKSTKYLAIAFFLISLGMAWNASRGTADADKGKASIMDQAVPASPAKPGATVPTAPSSQPAVPVPTAPSSVTPVPAAPASTTPAPEQQQPAPTPPASGG